MEAEVTFFSMTYLQVNKPRRVEKELVQLDVLLIYDSQINLSLSNVV